jgi:hypothetical protein
MCQIRHPAGILVLILWTQLEHFFSAASFPQLIHLFVLWEAILQLLLDQLLLVVLASPFHGWAYACLQTFALTVALPCTPPSSSWMVLIFWAKHSMTSLPDTASHLALTLHALTLPYFLHSTHTTWHHLIDWFLLTCPSLSLAQHEGFLLTCLVHLYMLTPGAVLSTQQAFSKWTREWMDKGMDLCFVFLNCWLWRKYKWWLKLLDPSMVLSSCGALNKVLALSEFQFSHL